MACRTSSAGSYPEASPRPAVEKAVTASYCSWNAAAGTQCSRPGLPAPGGQSRGIDAPLGRAEQQFAELGAEAGRGERRREGGRPADRALLLDVPTQELGHDGVLLGRGEQAGRRVATQQRRAAQHAVGVGVEGAGQRLADGAGDPAGDPRAELGGGLAAEGQDEDLLRVDAGVDPRRDRLDDRRRLPRAGAGEHEQRAARMVDDGLLRGVQRRGRGADGLTRDEPVDRPALAPPLRHPPMESRAADSSGTAGTDGAAPQVRG